MLVIEKSGLPVFHKVYSGALKDVSTLVSTLSEASTIDLKNISIIMDKGFASKQNIDFLLYGK
jgi:transposase